MKHPNMPSSKEHANINHSTTSSELIGHGTTDINYIRYSTEYLAKPT